jgi:hypothetical protein
MKIVIPLAGPDFERSDGTVKAEMAVQGRSLLKQALESRPWWRDGTCVATDLTFVLRDTVISRGFAERWLAIHYPECRVVWLSHYAQGAALSALAGVAAIAHISEPVIIDLVDILYDADLMADNVFQADPGLGGVALVFEAQSPAYSYLRTGPDGFVTQAAEKRVIARHASAGTYIFRTPSIFMSALSENLADPGPVTHADLFFVCPVFNGVLQAGLRVAIYPVSNVRDVKMMDSSAPLATCS